MDTGIGELLGMKGFLLGRLHSLGAWPTISFFSGSKTHTLSVGVLGFGVCVETVHDSFERQQWYYEYKMWWYVRSCRVRAGESCRQHLPSLHHQTWNLFLKFVGPTGNRKIDPI